ncbi:MAG TPA: DUF6677 family protein [Bryobacteraceae bacterium]|nr:DUF6677 family protein [Bryobacteraceae bacterium]
MRTRRENQSPRRARSVPAAALAVFGWLVPGGGYLLIGRKRQFALFLLLVSVAFGAGLALHGGILWPQPEELQGLDGFTGLVARAGALVKALAGGPYLLARLSDYSQGFLEGHLHEYGTMLLVVAGLLNLLALADAWELRKAEQH